MRSETESAWEEVEEDTEGLIALNADLLKNEMYLFFKFKNKITGKEFLDVIEDWLEKSREIEEHLLELH